MEDEIFNIGDMAKYLRCSTMTARRWCKAGKLPAFKLGSEWKVRKNDIDRLLKKKIEAASALND